MVATEVKMIHAGAWGGAGTLVSVEVRDDEPKNSIKKKVAAKVREQGRPSKRRERALKALVLSEAFSTCVPRGVPTCARFQRGVLMFVRTAPCPLAS